jgi:excisionase family DNA binding protein
MSDARATSFDQLFETLADRIASRIETRLRAAATPAMRPRLLSVEQAATYIGRTKDAVQHLVSGGKLPCVRCDKRIFLDIQDLDRWIEQNKLQLE